MSGQSLDEFLAELKKSMAGFAVDYVSHNQSDPDKYPLKLPDDNTGLWFEFFTGHWYGEQE